MPINSSNTVVRLCVAVKRQLQVYHWKGRDFLEHSENIDLLDIPRTLVWCDQTVIIGCKNEYYLFDVSLLVISYAYFANKINQYENILFFKKHSSKFT